MHQMLQTVKSSGYFGVGVLIVTIVLGIGGVFMLAKIRKRCLFYTFTGVATVPLILGVIGTGVGYAETFRALGGAAEADPTLLNSMLSQARIPLFLGAGGFGALLLVSLAGLLLCKGVCDGEDEDEEATERVK